MKNEKTDLSLRERINNGLARYWKIAVFLFIALMIVMGAVLYLGFHNRDTENESAMLAEEIQDAYTEWIQEIPENRDNSDLDQLTSRAIAEYPKKFAAQRAYFTIGMMSIQEKEWDKAAENFILLADKWEDSYLAPVSLYNAGSAREESGDFEGAAELWQRVVDNYAEVSPDAPESLFNLGRLAEGRGDTAEAIEFYKDVNSRFPKSRWTDLSKSRILVLEGR